MIEPLVIRNLYLNRFVFWTGTFIVMQLMGLFSIAFIDWESFIVDNTTCPEHPTFFTQIQSASRMQSNITLLCFIALVLGGYLLVKVVFKGKYARRFSITSLFVISTAIAMAHVSIVIVLAIHQDDIIDLVFFANNYSACFNHEDPTFGRTTLQILFTFSMMMCFASLGMMYYYLKWFADYSAVQNLTRSEMSAVLHSAFNQRRQSSMPPTYEESTRFQEGRVTLNQRHVIARYLAERDEENQMNADFEDVEEEPVYVNIYEMMYNPNLIYGDDFESSSHFSMVVDVVQNEVENRVEEIVDAIQDAGIEESDEGISNESGPASDVIDHSDEQMETDGGNDTEN